MISITRGPTREIRQGTFNGLFWACWLLFQLVSFLFFQFLQILRFLLTLFFCLLFLSFPCSTNYSLDHVSLLHQRDSQRGDPLWLPSPRKPSLLLHLHDAPLPPQHELQPFRQDQKDFQKVPHHPDIHLRRLRGPPLHRVYSGCL